MSVIKKSFAAAQDTKDIELIGSTADDLSTVYFAVDLYLDLVNTLPSVLDMLETNGKQFEWLMGRNFNHYSILLNELRAKPFLSIGYLFLGEFFTAVGRQDESLKNIQLAKGMFQEMGMDYWLNKTREALRRL